LVEIFLTIFSTSEYVLLDEPFNGVSPIHIDDIKNAIKSQSRNKGFILTDHDYRNIMDISSRIILLHDGGTREIQDKEDLEKWGYIPEGNTYENRKQRIEDREPNLTFP
jgi:ABC-type lipopolysaccharide export system ATPase subunit